MRKLKRVKDGFSYLPVYAELQSTYLRVAYRGGKKQIPSVPNAAAPVAPPKDLYGGVVVMCLSLCLHLLPCREVYRSSSHTRSLC